MKTKCTLHTRSNLIQIFTYNQLNSDSFGVALICRLPTTQFFVYKLDIRLIEKSSSLHQRALVHFSNQCRIRFAVCCHTVVYTIQSNILNGHMIVSNELLHTIKRSNGFVAMNFERYISIPKPFGTDDEKWRGGGAGRERYSFIINNIM